MKTALAAVNFNDWRGAVEVAAHAPLVLRGRGWQRPPSAITSVAD
jgi:hypothetical protein